MKSKPPADAVPLTAGMGVVSDRFPTETLIRNPSGAASTETFRPEITRSAWTDGEVYAVTFRSP